MTRIKFCGLSKISDIEAANEIMPDYIGFVFWKNSRRYISPENAVILRKILKPEIISVGVFVNEKIEVISEIIRTGAISAVQLHGSEDDEYISLLRERTHSIIIKAFRIEGTEDVMSAEKSIADYVMLDSGKGTGRLFDWRLAENFLGKKFFLAGGLDAHNVSCAIEALRPYAVDVSSGIETDGRKDIMKMKMFYDAVRRVDNNDE